MKDKFLLIPIAVTLLLLLSEGSAAQGPLPLNNKVSGNITSSAPQVWDITTTADGLLRFTFTAVSPADLYLTLYDNNGTTVIGSPVESYNNSIAILSADGLAPGTYHVKVTPFGTAYGSYTIADSLFVSPLANDIEPNGSRASALVLPMNNMATGHSGYYYNNARDTADWYKVTTNADGLLRIYLNTQRSSVYSNNPLDMNVTLYDNNATTQLAAIEVYAGNNPASGILTADGLAPGTYYIKVQPYSTSEFADYTIADTLFTLAIPTDQEPNGSAATALALPLNGSGAGHLGYFYNNLRDTMDWYKVTTTANGLLKVFLTTARGSIYSTNPLDVNVTVYDNNGTTQLGSKEVFNANNPATDSLTIDGLAPGTYYIKVQPYSTNEFAGYTLSNTLLIPPLAPDLEPNGNRASAVVLPLNNTQSGQVGYYYNNLRDTADWYQVTTTTDGLLRVRLTTSRGSIYGTNPLDVNVTLYDNDGTTQLGAMEVFSANNPATNVINADGLAPGTYYIKVQPYSTSEFAVYTITDSLLAPLLANDAEPNGVIANAIALPLNNNLTGHLGYYYNNQRDTMDWYKVTTNADGLLRVYLTTARGSVYSNNPLDVNVTLYDNNGSTQLGATEVFNANGPATNVITTDGLAPGTYYIKVAAYSTAEFADYTITDSLLLPAIPSDIEPNGTTATAIVLPLNASAKGHTGYYYNNARDTADWYRVTVPTAGPLNLYLSSQRGSVLYSNNPLDMVMTVYSSDGTTQLGSREVFKGNGPATDSLNFIMVPAGTYFVKITDYSSSEFANYTLVVADKSGGLPVTLIDFNGTLRNKQALLGWRTASETNNKGFEVERSIDGRAFTALGFVDGHGNSSVLSTYGFTDNRPSGGPNYYRLKQVDFDGNYTYSAIVEIDFKAFGWTIVGNPITSNSCVQLQLPNTSKVVVQVISLDGRVIFTIDKGKIAEGTYNIPLHLGQLAAGTYIIRVVVDDQSFSKMTVK